MVAHLTLSGQTNYAPDSTDNGCATIHARMADSYRSRGAGPITMLCPACKDNDNSVIDSRLSEGGLAVRRRRLCRICGRRFTTKERVEEELRVTVLKANGQRVPYSRENIVRGLERACYKLHVTDAQISELVDRVEEEIFTHHDREVSTEQIGRYVGEPLRKLNPVAYVRFMSVHRKFETVDEFIEAISEVRARAAVESPDQQTLFEG